jgi:hypothetical protein
MEKWIYISISAIFVSAFLAMGFGKMDTSSREEREAIEAMKNGYEQVYDKECRRVLWKKVNK